MERKLSWPPGGVWLAVLSLFGSAQAGAVRAQVIEIGPDGAVTTFSGPTIFTDTGATALGREAAAVRSRAASAEDYQWAAAASALSVDLIAAVAWRESRLRSGLVSSRGARGEMQLMPATARALGVDANDAGQNVRGGAAYLSTLMRRYHGDLVKTLAAYNAGPGAVDRYGGMPPFKETQDYVAAVLERLSQSVVPVSATTTVRR